MTDEFDRLVTDLTSKTPFFLSIIQQINTKLKLYLRLFLRFTRALIRVQYPGTYQNKSETSAWARMISGLAPSK